MTHTCIHTYMFTHIYKHVDAEMHTNTRAYTNTYMNTYSNNRRSAGRAMCVHVAVCCSALQCVAVCCSALQCVAVCCSALPCVAVCWGSCNVCARVRIVCVCACVCAHVSECVWYTCLYIYRQTCRYTHPTLSCSNSSSRRNTSCSLWRVLWSRAACHLLSIYERCILISC